MEKQIGQIIRGSVFLFFAVFFSFCGGESDTTVEKSFSDFEGEWKLLKSSRDGEETKSMDGAVFVFAKDTTLSTNIPGLEKMGKLQLHNDKISIENPLVGDFKYQYSDSNDNAMTLKTKIKGHDFAFHLQRVK